MDIKMSYEQEILREHARKILETISHSDVDNHDFENGKEAVAKWLLTKADIMISNKAIDDVIAERKRQVEVEGWTAEHDDEHDPGELACSGAAYALNAGCVLYPFDGVGFGSTPPDFFMWDLRWWKPSTPRRDLVKAAALILAEIERIDRGTKKK